MLAQVKSWLTFARVAAASSAFRRDAFCRAASAAKRLPMKRMRSRSFMWTVYGLAIGDVWVYGPNGTGLGLGLIQLASIPIFDRC